jgi:hypothetical protein
MQKMNFSDSIIIDATPEIYERLLAMEEKRKKRKAAFTISMLKATAPI